MLTFLFEDVLVVLCVREEFDEVEPSDVLIGFLQDDGIYLVVFEIEVHVDMPLELTRIDVERFKLGGRYVTLGKGKIIAQIELMLRKCMILKETGI